MYGRFALRTLWLAGVIAVLTLVIPMSAHAQDGPSPRQQLDECLEGGPYPYGPPTCTFDSEGNLIDRDVPGEPGDSSGLGGFILFGLMWAAIPMVIAGSVASSRGESVGVALLWTLVLGWIGLLIVVFLQKREVVEAAQTAISSAGRGDVADQIRKLGELRDEGLLTEEEFRAKKAHLLGTA